MPTYVYRCETCHHQFELRQSFHDVAVQDCPRCHHRVRRVLLPASIVFRGQGWYSTDKRGEDATSKSKKSEADA